MHFERPKIKEGQHPYREVYRDRSGHTRFIFRLDRQLRTKGHVKTMFCAECKAVVRFTKKGHRKLRKGEFDVLK